jgi:hypothetical protein
MEMKPMYRNGRGQPAPPPDDGAFYFALFCFYCARRFPILPGTETQMKPDSVRWLTATCPHCEREYTYETIDLIPYQHNEDNAEV